MATTYNSVEMTANPAKAIHAGVNAINVNYTLPATASGVTSVNICKLPAGAQVLEVGLMVPAAAQGDAADKYWIEDNFGTDYMATAVPANIAAGVDSPLGFGFNRLTSSGHLVLQMETKAATGTSALNIQVTALYLSEKSGD